MNIMAEAWWASTHIFPLSFTVWLLTMVMKHDYIGGTDFWAISRQIKPKVQYMIVALLGNTSRVIQMLKIQSHW